MVPEHFETRTLYNDDCPGIPQVIVLFYNLICNWVISADNLISADNFCDILNFQFDICTDWF